MEQLVKILPQKDKIELIYLYENSIRSKVVSNNQMMEGTMQDPLVIGSKENSSKNKVESSKLEYWYGNHLFVYGVHVMKYNADNNHKVFFIYKLSAP